MSASPVVLDTYEESLKMEDESEKVNGLAEDGSTPIIDAASEIHVEMEFGQDYKCGYRACTPRWLQPFANIKAFTAFCGPLGFMTSTLMMYIASQVTTIERVFGFSSTGTGFLLSCNDIGFLVTVIFISHFARNVNKPRVLALSSVLFGLAGILGSLPYILDRPPDIRSEFSSTDANSTGSSNMSEALCLSASERSMYLSDDRCSGTNYDTKIYASKVAFAIFVISMMMQGVAKAPRYSMIGPYVDDNVPKIDTGLYIGVIFAMAILGPGAAFAAGGAFSKMYVTLEETDLSPRDPRWIGAWWLGFLVFGCGALFLSTPLFFFPKKLKTAPKREQKVAVNQYNIAENVKELPRSLRRIFSKPVFLTCLASFCSIFFVVSGTVSFAPKYIESQYTQPTWRTNYLLGASKIASTASGTFIGGYLTRRLKLSMIGCTYLGLASILLEVIIYSAVFSLGCPQPVIEGMIGTVIDPAYETSDVCASGCDCSGVTFLPVCADERSFYSPCHAGCTEDMNMVFTNCTCASNSTALPGLCPPECPYMNAYLVVVTLITFIGTISIIPRMLVSMRAVEERDKTLAMGTTAFVTSCLGWMPAPVVFGKLIDSVCVLWKSSCGVQGSCALYDLVSFRKKFHGIAVAMMALSFISSCFTLYFLRKIDRQGKVVKAPDANLALTIDVPLAKPNE